MGKKIILVHPIFGSNQSHTLVYRKGYGTAIPLGLAYIAAALRDQGHHVMVYDFQVTRGDFFQFIRNFQPDVFGISVTTPTAKTAGFLAGEIKKKYPGRPIIVGGPHISIVKDKAFTEAEGYDYLVCGEGEKTIVELMDVVSGERSPGQVKGICYRESGRIFETEARGFIEDLDQLPHLPIELFNYRKYVPTPGTFIHLPSIAFLSSRGCPFNCAFCNKDMFGNTVRQMSARRMVDEIIEIKRKYHVREINFYDDTFTLSKKRVFEFCDLLRSRNVDIKWKCDSRVDTITREMIFEMKKAGCFSISFGVESGDNRILKKIGKGITTEQVKNVFNWSREEGIFRTAFFMINLPGDTRESIEKTIRFSREIEPDYVSFELTKPLPGTKIREALSGEANLNIKDELWKDWDSCTVSNKVFYTQNDLTEAYLEDAFKRAIKHFYITPRYLMKSIIRLRSWAQFKSYVAAALNILMAKVVRTCL